MVSIISATHDCIVALLSLIQTQKPHLVPRALACLPRGWIGTVFFAPKGF